MSTQETTDEASAATDCYPSFPDHECGLYLEHNPNRDVYETVADWLKHEHNREQYDWRDDASRDRAVKTNELWTLHWYPNTPIGFNAVAAPTLAELLTWADEFAG